MDNIFRGLFLNIDKLNTHKKLKRESIIFQCYESFLKKLYKYYEYDENMEGLSNGLLYEIKYIYKFYNGNHPLTIYPHVIKLNELSYELPEEIRLKWVKFYDVYFMETLQI